MRLVEEDKEWARIASLTFEEWMQEVDPKIRLKGIKPEDILLNRNDEIVGFTMTNIDNISLPMLRLFNTIFWKTNNLNINKIMKIVEFMQETLFFW